MVGTRLAEVARSWVKNGRSRLATGLEASTSGSTSSSAARRLTEVVLKFRRKSGRSPTALASESDSEEIAPIITSRLPTRALRSSRRAARVPESSEPSTIRFSSAVWSRVSSAKVCREVDRKGFRYLKPSLRFSAELPPWAIAKPLMTFLKSATVSSSRVLKISSRSTSEIVSD